MGVNLLVERSVLALSVGLAVKSTADVRKHAKIVLEDAIALKASVEVVNALALLLVENVIQTCAEIAGSGAATVL